MKLSRIGHFKTIQDFSRVVLSSLFMSQIFFPKFDVTRPGTNSLVSVLANLEVSSCFVPTKKDLEHRPLVGDGCMEIESGLITTMHNPKNIY